MSVKPVTSVIIENNEGKILLARQAKWGDNWTLPGGHIDKGEDIISAAVREGEEETGLELEPVELYCFGEEISPPDFKNNIHVIFFHVHCRALSEEIDLEKEEIQEIKWGTVNEALSEDLPEGFLRTLEVFKKYKENHISTPIFLSIK